MMYLPASAGGCIVAQPISWEIVFMGLGLIGLGYYLYTKVGRLRERKRVCTAEVPAVITAVRRGYSIDGTFGGRGPHYNADYQYEYEGKVYESHTDIYGQLRTGKPNVGETVMIHINPFEPATIFDPLAEAAMNFLSFGSVFFGIGGAVVAIGHILGQLFG
jgi:hypothetical protein